MSMCASAGAARGATQPASTMFRFENVHAVRLLAGFTASTVCCEYDWRLERFTKTFAPHFFDGGNRRRAGRPAV